MSADASEALDIVLQRVTQFLGVHRAVYPVFYDCCTPSAVIVFGFSHKQAGDVLRLGCTNSRLHESHATDTVWKHLYLRDCVPPSYPREISPSSPSYLTLVRKLEPRPGNVLISSRVRRVPCPVPGVAHAFRIQDWNNSSNHALRLA
jgi:hypothetical protein